MNKEEINNEKVYIVDRNVCELCDILREERLLKKANIDDIVVVYNIRTYGYSDGIKL